MRILVTGAAGFIGSHLCERLLGRGDEVIGLDNFDPFYAPAVKRANVGPFAAHERFRLIEADIRDAEALERIWDSTRPGPQAVVHLAAKAGVRPSIEDPIGYERTNVLGTMNLLKLAAAAEPRPRFIFASSSSVYGNNPTIPFSETDNVDHPISPYAATKKACELIGYTYHHLYGLPFWALRFFTVYGPRQRPDLAIHKFTASLMRSEPIEMYGDGANSRDYTYIDDAIDGTIAAIDRCEGYEIINIGSRHPVPLDEMIRTIESATGQTANVQSMPMQPGDVERTFADVQKAARLLGYDPKTPFAEGVRRFVQWWKQTYQAG